MTLQEKITQAVWVANTLFERQKATGSTSNLSFRHEEKIYISAGGSCFGTLKQEEFAVLDLDGTVTSQIKPSKEYPLHLILYRKNDTAQAVLHTHSFYSALWSCLEPVGKDNIIPSYTPYLKMKLGDIGYIPYAPPGTQKLFDIFAGSVGKQNGYLLAHHGPVVCAPGIMDAFYALEELEESAHIAWELRSQNIKYFRD